MHGRVSGICKYVNKASYFGGSFLFLFLVIFIYEYTQRIYLSMPRAALTSSPDLVGERFVPSGDHCSGCNGTLPPHFSDSWAAPAVLFVPQRTRYTAGGAVSRILQRCNHPVPPTAHPSPLKDTTCVSHHSGLSAAQCPWHTSCQPP